MSTGQGDGPEGWAILELMGHRQLAGQIREVTVAGAPMLRIDVPEVGSHPAFTQFYGGSSVYAITPVTEEVARRAAERFVPPAPVHLLGLPPARPPLTTPADLDDDIGDQDVGAHVDLAGVDPEDEDLDDEEDHDLEDQDVEF